MKIFVSLLLAGAALLAQDTVYDESFDPATLKEPEPEWPLVINPVVRDSVALQRLLPTSAPADRQREGYRIQVLNTPQAAAADSLRQVLERGLTVPVYVIYDVPNYKVRVGDFVNRREAEAVQNKIRSLGYRSAWIVRTRIEPREEEP